MAVAARVGGGGGAVGGMARSGQRGENVTFNVASAATQTLPKLSTLAKGYRKPSESAERRSWRTPVAASPRLAALARLRSTEEPAPLH